MYIDRQLTGMQLAMSKKGGKEVVRFWGWVPKQRPHAPVPQQRPHAPAPLHCVPFITHLEANPLHHQLSLLSTRSNLARGLHRVRSSKQAEII